MSETMKLWLNDTCWCMSGFSAAGLDWARFTSSSCTVIWKPPSAVNLAEAGNRSTSKVFCPPTICAWSVELNPMKIKRYVSIFCIKINFGNCVHLLFLLLSQPLHVLILLPPPGFAASCWRGCVAVRCQFFARHFPSSKLRSKCRNHTTFS